jgi:uncharacterized membrane protein
MEWILVLGMIALFALYYNQSERLARLEKALDAFRLRAPDARDGTAPLPEREMAAWVARPPSPSIRLSEMLGQERAETEEEVEGKTEEREPALPRESLGSLFERFVGGRLLVWIGGIALAVAGLLLVRYSIELGLATPRVRMIMAAVFGILLLAAGELARSRPGSQLDPRVAQALVGAGILVLYATPYGALVLYQLISTAAASALMVAVTAVALLLSLRHGAPTAVLGLVGGFVTPLLVGDPHSSAIPLLTYLALLDVALFGIAWRRGWTWLAAAAVVLSFVWAFWLTAAPKNDALAGGLFVVGLSIAASFARPGKGWHLDFLRPVGIGLVQLALLVARTDLGPAAWGLFGLLALAAILLSSRRREFELLPAFALAVALVLLAAKALDPDDPFAPTAAAAMTLLFGLSAIIGAFRSREPLLWTAIGAASFSAPAIILRLARPDYFERPIWGGLMIVLAAGPALLAWNRRKSAGEGDSEVALLVAAAAALLLLGIAVNDLVPRDLRGTAWLLLAAGTAFAALRLGARALSLLAVAAAAFAIVWTVAMVPGLWGTIDDSIAGMPALVTGLPTPAQALQRLVPPAAALFVAWHWLPEDLKWPRRVLLAAAGIFLAGAAYVFAKQVFALASEADFAARGFAERLLITQALFLAGWLLGWRRTRLPWLDAEQLRLIGILVTGLAAARLLWFDLIVDNPAFTTQQVGALPVLNLLLPAYLLSAFWLYAARRRAGDETLSGVWLALFLAALIAGVMLMVRQAFQGAILTAFDMPKSEFYGYSLAGLLLSIALLLSGIRLPDKALRIAGLGLLTATIFKVFLVDADALEGILRILSFLGLGIALIGVGKLYATVLSAEARPKPA